MADFIVTEAAGKEVAGQKSPGAGKKITLTELQAEHPLRLGHIALPTTAAKAENKKAAS